MKHLVNLRRVLAAGVLAISITGAAAAQDFVLPYNKAPETAQEFWAAAKYDLSLGNHQRAAQMIGTKFTEIEVMIHSINEAAAESGVWAEVPIIKDSTSYLRIF